MEFILQWAAQENLVKALSKLMVGIKYKNNIKYNHNQIHIKNKKISSIIDNKGKERKADIYISNLDLFIFTKI